MEHWRYMSPFSFNVKWLKFEYVFLAALLVVFTESLASLLVHNNYVDQHSSLHAFVPYSIMWVQR
jgi:ABC-type multidrug transport system permease subunit